MPTPADHYRAAEEFATLAHEEMKRVTPDAFWVAMVVSAGQLEATLALAVEAHQEATVEEYARTNFAGQDYAND
jgi:hypothetical protein